jgi:hypothetical protein
MMGLMPEPVTVWAVDLLREPKKDREGRLSLEAEHLVFEPRTGGTALRIPVGSIRRARRLRGSPVLLVAHDRDGHRLETAFYFVQPPPLDPVIGRSNERPTPFSFGRSSKRRARRENVGYLGLSNRGNRERIDRWARAVNDAMTGRSGRSD